MPLVKGLMVICTLFRSKMKTKPTKQDSASGPLQLVSFYNGSSSHFVQVSIQLTNSEICFLTALSKVTLP